MTERAAHLIRQWDLIPDEVLGTEINVVGAGAIGGVTALTLAKMGFNNITLWDPDVVSVENLSCQVFKHSDIGRTKVEAMADVIWEFTGVTVMAMPHAATGKMRFGGIVIAAVDSMKVRKEIWEAHKSKALHCRLFLDPRMGAESALLYGVRPMIEDDARWYEKTLYTDADAVHERCTAKATMYTAFMLGGFVAKTVKSFLVNEPFAKTMSWAIGGDSMLCYRHGEPAMVPGVIDDIQFSNTSIEEEDESAEDDYDPDYYVEDDEEDAEVVERTRQRSSV